MGSMYKGWGGHKTYVGHCDEGIIYSGSGNRNPIGRYENGYIYNQFKEHVGSYGGGSIYNQFGKHVASYEGGIVYNQYLNAGVGKTSIGSYDGNPAEAAALVLLFLGGNAVNSQNKTTFEENTNTSASATTYSSSGDSDTGCLGSLFSLIGLLLMSVLKILFYFYKIMFLYWVIPVYATITVYGFVLMILFGVSGLVNLMLPLAILETALVFISIPYWVILFTQKRKRKMKWGETLKYYGKWLIKGPWAYKDIIELKNKPMSN